MKRKSPRRKRDDEVRSLLRVLDEVQKTRSEEEHHGEVE